jgi:thiol-disulfide isomerase/thioredoxin
MRARSTGWRRDLIWGAHAPRVLAMAPRHRGLCSVTKTGVSAMAPKPAREARRSLAHPGHNVLHLEHGQKLPILTSSAKRVPRFLEMKNLALILVLSLVTPAFAASPAEQQVAEAIKAPNLSVVHLWAPWCSNCQSELKSGGWLKTVKANPEVKFYFVSVWNGGDDGRAMLAKFELANQPNVTILADPGPRNGDAKIKRFLDLPLSWIPTTWVYKGGDLRYALNYGEVRFDVLQQFFADSNSKW